MMEFEIINYSDCTKEHLIEILNLRNEDSIRIWMANPEKISLDNHFNFIKKLRTDKDRIYYAVFHEGELVGTYNLTKENDGIWERGIFTAPKFHGTGVTKEMEGQILSMLPRNIFMHLTAKVKLNNVRSIYYHLKMSYYETGRDSEYIYFKKDIK